MYSCLSLKPDTGHNSQQEPLDEQIAAPSNSVVQAGYEGVSWPVAQGESVSSVSNDDNLKGKFRW